MLETRLREQPICSMEAVCTRELNESIVGVRLALTEGTEKKLPQVSCIGAIVISKDDL